MLYFYCGSRSAVIVQDVGTRWWSTVAIVDRILYLENTIKLPINWRLALSDILDHFGPAMEPLNKGLRLGCVIRFGNREKIAFMCRT